MWDIGMIAVSIAFFFVAIRYACLCDGLRNKKEEKQ